MDIFDYVKKYGDVTFELKPFNDIDNLVFSMLSYLDYTDTSINIKDHTIEYIAREYFKLNKYSFVRRKGIAQKDAYLLLEEVVKTKRYKDIIMHDYVYSTSINKQFSAMMFRINDNLEYMSFEGTDELISGWKEDLYLSCIFPVPAQRDAIKYANEHIKIFGPNVIIGGHSKGGNLALVAGMYTKALKQFRVLKVYNNDGPGLRLREFNSKEYRRLKRKYIHIVPDSSMIGILLRNDTYTVVKSTRNNIFAHAIATWKIDDDKLMLGTLSKKSKQLEQSIISWLMNHSDVEKDKMVTELFTAIENANIKSIQEINDIPKLIKLIENIRNIDDETKEIIKSLIKENFIKIGRDE